MVCRKVRRFGTLDCSLIRLAYSVSAALGRTVNDIRPDGFRPFETDEGHEIPCLRLVLVISTEKLTFILQDEL